MITASANTARYSEHLVKRHPCLSEEGHAKLGRIHLPVSPVCNIQCRFCQRCFNKWESRPGVSRKILYPEEAVGVVERALEHCPEITVVGIAGPGDALASEHALAAFRKVHLRFPGLIKCLSTNGLELANKAEQLAYAGVNTVTVTVNAVNPVILDKICAGIIYYSNHRTGLDAAKILIASQLEGIQRIVNLGIFVKINFVLIPGVNDEHLEEVAQTTSSLGASLINIIPLIPQHEFENHPAPDCRQLQDARETAEAYLTVFRHCKHCRADACGIPGSDKEYSSVLYEDRVATFSHG